MSPLGNLQLNRFCLSPQNHFLSVEFFGARNYAFYVDKFLLNDTEMHKIMNRLRLSFAEIIIGGANSDFFLFLSQRQLSNKWTGCAIVQFLFRLHDYRLFLVSINEEQWRHFWCLDMWGEICDEIRCLCKNVSDLFCDRFYDRLNFQLTKYFDIMIIKAIRILFCDDFVGDLFLNVLSKEQENENLLTRNKQLSFKYILAIWHFI